MHENSMTLLMNMGVQMGGGLKNISIVWGLLVTEASFNKNTTYQGRGIGIRDVRKEYKDASKNSKTEI